MGRSVVLPTRGSTRRQGFFPRLVGGASYPPALAMNLGPFEQSFFGERLRLALGPSFVIEEFGAIVAFRAFVRQAEIQQISPRYPE